MKIPQHYTAIPALILLSLIYSVFGMLTREFAKDLAMFQQIWTRTVVALLICALITPGILNPARLARLQRTDWALLLCRSVLCYVVGVSAFVLAVMATTLAKVALIYALPFSSIWGRLFYRDQIRPFHWVCLGLSFTGVIVMGASGDLSIRGIGQGELWALLSVASTELAMVLRRSHSPDLKDGELNFLFLLFSAAATVIAGILFKEPLWVCMDASLLKLLVVSGVLVAGAGYLANYTVRTAPLILVSALLLMEWIFTALIAYAAYDEPLTGSTAMAAVLILGGGILTSLGRPMSGSDATSPVTKC